MNNYDSEHITSTCNSLIHLIFKAQSSERRMGQRLIENADYQTWKHEKAVATTLRDRDATELSKAIQEKNQIRRGVVRIAKALMDTGREIASLAKNKLLNAIFARRTNEHAIRPTRN